MLGSGNTLIQIGALTDWGGSSRNLEWSGEDRAGRMLEWVSGKLEYTEEEAASALGISIGELRSLVQTHVISEETAGDMPSHQLSPHRSSSSEDVVAIAHFYGAVLERA